MFLNYRPKNRIDSFDDMDSKRSYQKNLRTQPHDWVYRNKDISYRFNNYGFRGKEFSTVEWDKSVIVIGDSIVFGCGLAEDDTIPKQLEKIANIPCVNLGISASGIDLACVNSLILHDNYPTPKAIVHIWTDMYRYTDFSPLWPRMTSNYNVSKGSSEAKPFIPRWKDYNARLNWGQRSEFYIKSDRALWKNKTCYIECSFHNYEWTKEKGIDFLPIKDLARDFDHPGIKSCRNAAKKIAKKLNKCNI